MTQTEERDLNFLLNQLVAEGILFYDALKTLNLDESEDVFMKKMEKIANHKKQILTIVSRMSKINFEEEL